MRQPSAAAGEERADAASSSTTAAATTTAGEGGAGRQGAAGTGGNGERRRGPGHTLGTAANPTPTYPPAARRRGIEGEVVRRVLVSAEGRPQAVEIARSSGSDLLDEATRETIARWRFRPALHGGEAVAGKAVAGKAVVPVRFKLSER